MSGAPGQFIWPTGSVVYFIQAEPGGAIKIGVTRDLRSRLSSLRIGSPLPLRVLAYMSGDAALEGQLHARFAAVREHGEWHAAVPELLTFIQESARPLEREAATLPLPPPRRREPEPEEVAGDGSGRPKRMGPQLVEAIDAHVRGGGSMADIARAARMSPQQLSNFRRGVEADPRYSFTLPIAERLVAAIGGRWTLRPKPVAPEKGGPS